MVQTYLGWLMTTAHGRVAGTRPVFLSAVLPPLVSARGRHGCRRERARHVVNASLAFSENELHRHKRSGPFCATLFSWVVIIVTALLSTQDFGRSATLTAQSSGPLFQLPCT